MKLIFFSLASVGKGISGGDRIYIEFAKRWSQKAPLTIFISQDGFEMCKRQGLTGEKIDFKISDYSKFGFVLNYFSKIAYGIWLGIIYKIDNPSETIVYSATEFWMDSLPSFILKVRYPSIKWVATWYQTAPNPLIGRGSLWYWLAQLPIRPLIWGFANYALVNNELEKKIFPNKSIVVLGAVNVDEINDFRKKNVGGHKIYDAVFQGRLHPQKGVVELIKIWRLVVNKLPQAKLAIIGDGALMEKVKEQITMNQLTNNIKLFGYLFDGDQKYKVFNSSKIVVHPALYDSGGMAAAEAMAFGLPCVGFDLPSYESYYPKGMLKCKINDLDDFANKVRELLSNKTKYNKIALEAEEMINKYWSWDKRSDETLKKIIK